MKNYKRHVKDGKLCHIHRLIMEEQLGRKLTSDELVHHKDGDIHNNDIENLELTNRSKHTTFHIKINWENEEFRKACSQPLSEDHKRKIGLASKGRKLGESHKVNCSAARRKILSNGNTSPGKLSAEDIPVIRKMIRDGIDAFLICFIYQINRTMVSRIKNRKRWAWVQ